MATMESLIGLVNRIQRACTALGDHGGDDSTFSSLWDALPSVAVVGGQVYITIYRFILFRFIHIITAVKTDFVTFCVCVCVLFRYIYL